MSLTVADLFAALRASDSGRPRLTWYGADGERVELSARVLENWVAKTANLLVEETRVEEANSVTAAGSRTRVHLDLPPHWRTAVWTLAAWAVGAELSGPQQGPLGPDDVVVTTPERASSAPAGPLLVVMALPALAWSAGGIPAGALDANASTAGFGDHLPPLPGTDLAPLLVGSPAWETGVPLLEDAADYDAVSSLLVPLAADASLVMLGDGSPEASRVGAQERAQRRGVRG